LALPAAPAAYSAPAQGNVRPQDAGVGLGVLLRNADMIFNRTLREELARQRHHLQPVFSTSGKLFRQRRLTQVDLSHRIGIEAASSTAVIDQLAKRRLIRRERDTTDRRRINVTLTSAGRALEKPLTACAMRVNKLARNGLSNAELDALFTSVNRVIRSLQTRESNVRGMSRAKRNPSSILFSNREYFFGGRQFARNAMVDQRFHCASRDGFRFALARLRLRLLARATAQSFSSSPFHHIGRA